MTGTIYNMVVDFARPYKSNTVVVMRNDTLTRTLHFVLMNNGEAMDMTNVDYAVIQCTKSDQTIVYDADNVEICKYDASVFLYPKLYKTGEYCYYNGLLYKCIKSITVCDDDNPLIPGSATDYWERVYTEYINELEYTLPKSLTDTDGKETLCITLYASDDEGLYQQISSFDFYIVVRNELYTDVSTLTTDNMSGIRDAIEKCQSVVAEVETLKKTTAYPNPYALTVKFNSTTSDDIVYYGSEAATVDLAPYLLFLTEQGDTTDVIYPIKNGVVKEDSYIGS